jgi:hypothetical protein
MSLQGCFKTSICLAFSPFFFFFFFQWGFIILLHFLPRSSPSGVATMMGTAAFAIGTAVVDAAVRATLGLAPDGEPRTTEGVPEDVVEDSEGDPKVALDPVLEVEWEEALVEGAMIIVREVATPPPSRGARAPLLSAPRRATASGVATGEGMEVVLGHPTPYVSGDISVGEAMSTAHQALSQAQRIMHHEGEDLADERQRLQLWASLLKKTTVSEREKAWA